jgi:dTDP-4-amino-4,6-dideoxy-D-glucose acyltransferase
MLTGIKDIELMGDNVRDKLKKCGTGVRIYPLAKLAYPHVIELDDHCNIRDFVFIFAGQGVKIGQYSDIQPHVVIWGGGETIIGNRVSVGPGTVLLSAVYSHAEGLKMVDGLPEGSSVALYGKLVIEDDVYIGANCTLMPNITVGEGAVIGAASFVNKDAEPWGIYVGSPARKIGERER